MCSRSMISNPPMPDETYTPTSSRSESSGFHADIFIAKSAAASATWINRPIFFSSFFSIHRNGSKFLISPAILQSNPVVSNWVMVPTPLCPATRFFQLSSVPMPSAQTNPTPVTTTRRVNSSMLPDEVVKPWLLSLGVFVDVFDCVLHCAHLLCILVGHFNPERFFEGHYQFNLVERIRSQVVHEGRRGRNFRFIYTKLLDNNLFHAFFHAGHSMSSAICYRLVCFCL